VRDYPGPMVAATDDLFYAFSFDPQGNVIQRQNSGNTIGYTYDTASYEGYGHRGADYSSGGVNPAPDQDPAGFGGEFGYYTDRETGLLCLTHRYYDPGTGRFVTRDPSGYGGGVNLYGFAGDNPVNEMDPSGLDPQDGSADGDDPTTYLGNALNNLTADDWLNIARHDDVVKAMEALGNGASYIPLPENPVADAEGAGVLARAGEDLYVGTYGAAKGGLGRAGRLPDYTPHHVVQDAVNRASHRATLYKGITITLKKTIHGGLRTTGRPMRDLPTLRDHLAADTNELRNVLRQNGYQRNVVNRQLRELIRQNKALGGLDK
jgi:RHS repeat-associated protein